MVERAFEIFRNELAPLEEAGKLGGVLMQYPPYFTAKDRAHRERNLAEIESAAAMLDPWPVLVEFRHASWVAEENLEPTMRFLADHGLSFVAVDAPEIPGAPIMPRVHAATAPFGYVRFHGRNAGMWYAKTQTAADRFDYLYTPDELAEWREPIERLAEETERTYVMFNNCKYDYAPRNAREMAEILGEAVAPRRGGIETGEPAPEDAEVPAERRDEPGTMDTLF
jgi:uncharacterized protein YecE (DUF72 family)